MIEITNKVPLPEVKSRNVYPYDDMEVEDSFYVEGVSAQNICNCNYKRNKAGEKKFTVRKEGDGFRVWRIK